MNHPGIIASATTIGNTTPRPGTSKIHRMDEADLIRRCCQHDRQAQRAFYERHADRVYRLAMRLTANPHDAADITQDAFVQAFEHMRAFAGRSRIDTWLYRITTNLALQLFRCRARERKHQARIAQELPESTEPPTPNSDSSQSDLRAALAQLPDAQRAIIVLRYYQNMSYTEIAETLDVSPGTIASRLHRARVALCTLLDAESPQATEESPPLSHPTL